MIIVGENCLDSF